MIVVILLGFLATFIYFYINNKLSKIHYVKLDEAKLNISSDVAKKLKNYRNIAIFGLDSRAANQDESYEPGNRTDCIMIASINLTNNDVKLFSIYRDTYVDIDGYGLDKINHAYAYGGPQLAVATINKNFDLDIKEFVTANFKAIISLVDEVGGVEIEVKPEEVRFLNGYIEGYKKTTGISANTIKEPGTYTLDGVQALSYSRIRYTAGGDATRTDRMRTVLTKVFEKTKKMNSTQIMNVLDVVLPQLYTNIDKKDVLDEVQKVKNYKIQASKGWPYKIKGGLIDSVYYSLPNTLTSNVTELHKELFNDDSYKPSETVKNISEQIKKDAEILDEK